MDAFEVESCVRGQSLRDYVINVHFMCGINIGQIKLGFFPKICRFAKLKILQKFPAIWYIIFRQVVIVTKIK